ncbi:MAG: transposase, partial [Thaumarchaeota archaeon]|nr:transposase [Nitrososphaerota archaeon]
KQQESWLYGYYSKMLQAITTQVESAQKSIIALKKKGRPTGPLKFVKYSEYRTLTYNQSGFKIEKNELYLSKIGRISIIIHRDMPQDARIKQVVITKTKSSRWFACVTYDIDILIPKIKLKKHVGIDLGIRNFAYDSNGCATPNQQNLKKMLKPLRRIQRKISRRQSGSANRKKAIQFYRKIHERVTNRRRDFLHKVSTQYAKNHDIIFVEKLDKLNMLKNHRVARAIFDSGWGTFVDMLHYKCKMLVEVPSRNTTIKCSRCSNFVPKSLAVRIHRCDVCGLVIDRDENAAINILKKGLEIIGISNQENNLPQELREVTLVEISKRSLKQVKALGKIRETFTLYR